MLHTEITDLNTLPTFYNIIILEKPCHSIIRFYFNLCVFVVEGRLLLVLSNMSVHKTIIGTIKVLAKETKFHQKVN